MYINEKEKNHYFQYRDFVCNRFNLIYKNLFRSRWDIYWTSEGVIGGGSTSSFRIYRIARSIQGRARGFPKG